MISHKKKLSRFVDLNFPKVYILAKIIKKRDKKFLPLMYESKTNNLPYVYFAE